MQEDTQTTERTNDQVNNDSAETWDHLCGPDPNWGDALGEAGDNHE